MKSTTTRRISFLGAAAALSALLVATLAADAQAVTIPTVPVGNLGNVNDPLTGNLYGGVSYDYGIGTTEVTVGQYTAFLNAAATDTYDDGYAVRGPTDNNGNQNFLTDVGAYTESGSFYGKFDPGGNVFEWNEA